MNLAQLRKILAFYARCTPSFSRIGYVARGLPWSRPAGDFSGQRWLVTGASGGIAREIVRDAASRGAQVVAVARNPHKLGEMHAALGELTARVEPQLADLSLQRDVVRLLAELSGSAKQFDVLINCVGVLLDDHSLTGEGRETSFATNLLSHYVLTEGLIRRGLLGQGGLIINLSSGGQYNVPLSTAWLNIVDPRRYNGTAAYAFAKRAQLALSSHWNDTYSGSGIVSQVMHPGWVDTDGVKSSLPRFRKALKSILRDEAAGADTVIWLAATRPPVPQGEHLWFDRKPRTAHLFAHTRISGETPHSLATWLAAEQAKFPDASP